MYGIKDPSALLRPFTNLKQFTEELYAMFSAPGDAAAGTKRDASPEPAGETTTTKTTTESAAPDMNSVRKSRLESTRPEFVSPERSGDPHATTLKRSPAGDSQASTRRPIDQTDQSATAPARQEQAAKSKEVAKARSQHGERPKDFKPEAPFVPRKNREFKPKPVLDIGNFAGPPGAGGNSTTVLGLVTTAFTGDAVGGGYLSGSVDFYGDGPGQPATDAQLVSFVGVLLTEIMPVNTWIDNIQQYADPSGNVAYYAIVPVWVG